MPPDDQKALRGIRIAEAEYYDRSQYQTVDKSSIETTIAQTIMAMAMSMAANTKAMLILPRTSRLLRVALH